MKIVAVCLLLVAGACADYCVREFLDCHGSDLKSVWSVNDLEQCQKYCDANKECKSIQFTAHNICYLKNHVCQNRDLVASAGTDAVKVANGADCSEYEPKNSYCSIHHRNCWGNDIKTYLVVPSMERCRMYCDYVPECKSALRDFVGTCWLKSKACTRGETIWGLYEYSVKQVGGANCD